MKRSTSLLGAASLAVLLAACGGETTTAPVTPTSALTPGKPKFDDIPNSLDASIDVDAESMSLTAGGTTGTTTLFVSPTGGDGKPGCNLTGGTTLVVSVASSSNAVATVAISPNATFSSCGDVKTLTVTPVAQGTATITVSQVSNNSGGSFNFAPATFTVNVAPATVATTLTLAAPSPSSVVSGSAGPVALSATLTRTTGGAAVVGATIAFTVDGNAAGSASTDGTGKATVSYNPSALTVGSHTVVASFAGATIASTVYVAANSGNQTLSVSDASGPVIVPTVAGTLGNNGWYTSNVQVSWSVTDPESTVGSTTGCGVTSITTDTNGQTVTCEATSAGGTSSQSVTIKRDATAPTATATRMPAANANGWNNTNVSVTFTATDAMSGIASCTPVALFSADAANQSAAGTCTDNAGNTSAPASVTGINVDKTAPTISGNRSPAANGNGWNNTNVSVTFTCADALSGVDGSCGPDATVSAEGANQSVPGTVTDRAGNTASTSVTNISIDKTAPTAIGTKSPPANAAGWNNADVTVTFTMAPGDLSGMGTCTSSSTITDNTAASGQTVSGTCTDQAGNESALKSIVVKLDETLPTITGTPSPAANAAGWNKTDVTVTFACADALSGVASCTGPVSLTSEGNNLSAVGNVADVAGNTASTTVSPVKIDKTAPVVGSVSFTDPDIPVSGSTTLNASFTESLSGVSAGGATYTLNGGAPHAMVVTGSTASASVSGLPAGLYNVCVQVTDVAENASGATVNSCAYLAVYDPNGGFVTGGGWITSPEGACKNWSGCTEATVGKANFGFVSKYLPGRTTAPEGSTEFQFQAGNLKFKSTSYETLIVAGDRAQFWGTGTVNGVGSFAFRLTAIDNTLDKFRMEIWNGPRDTGTKIYDNQWGAAQDAALTTVIGGGSIQIKK